MGRNRSFTIKESLSELEGKKSKITGYKTSLKLKALLLIKSEKYKTLQEVADILEIHYATLQRWLVVYKQEGLDKYLSSLTRNKPSKILPAEIQEELSRKLGSKDSPFSGYVEVQEWLEAEHGIKIQYQWLWKFMTTKLNSKLKVPRKVNIKKDPQAEDSFFKTARSLEPG